MLPLSSNQGNTLLQIKGLNLDKFWDEFKKVDFEKIKEMLKEPNIIDGKNIYNPEEMKKMGFNYIGIGR